MNKGVTGGCIHCARCEFVRTSFFCGRKRLTMKQVYNTKGYCSDFKPKEGKEENGQRNGITGMEADAK